MSAENAPLTNMIGENARRVTKHTFCNFSSEDARRCKLKLFHLFLCRFNASPKFSDMPPVFCSKSNVRQNLRIMSDNNKKLRCQYQFYFSTSVGKHQEETSFFYWQGIWRDLIHLKYKSNYWNNRYLLVLSFSSSLLFFLNWKLASHS